MNLIPALPPLANHKKLVISGIEAGMHCPMSTLLQLSPKPLVFLGARIILVIFQKPLLCQLPVIKDRSLNYVICFEIPGKLFSLLCLYQTHLQRRMGI